MKGSVLDLIEIIIILFTISLVLFVGYFALGEVEAPMVEVGFNGTSIDDAQSALNIMDSLMPLVLIGLIIFVLISASMIETHPAMFAVSIIALIIVLILYMVMGNVFYEFSRAAEFTSTSNDLNNTIIIWDNILLIGFVFGLITMIALYAKYKTGSGGGISGGAV